MKLSGNTILITGGTSGIGLGFAEDFLQKSNKVIICGRRKKRLDEIKSKYGNIETIECDVSDEVQRENLAKSLITDYPDLNVIINNAGIQLLADLTDIKLEKIRNELETNLIAPIHLSSLFIPHLKTKQNPAIINISSGLAFVPLAPVAVYCATKAALHSVSMSLRYQLRDTSIKVFEIIPPSVDTELGKERRKDKNQSHGGIPVIDFIKESMEAIANDKYEVPIDGAKNFYEKRDSMFTVMNK